MKKAILAMGIVVGFCSGAIAEDGAGLYKKCATCHGAQGEKPALGKSKIIKDMSKADITAALKGYQDGSYGGAQKVLMKGQVASLDNAKISAISEFIGK